MLVPQKYKQKKIDQLIFRNVSSHMRDYTLRVVTPEGHSFECQSIEPSLNPIFSSHVNTEFWEEFYSLCAPEIEIQLLAYPISADNQITIDEPMEVIFQQTINLYSIAFVGADLTAILPNTLPIMFLRIPQLNSKSEFFTKDSSLLKLINRKLLEQSLSPDVIKNRYKTQPPQIDQRKQKDRLVEFYSKAAVEQIRLAKSQKIKEQLAEACQQMTQSQVQQDQDKIKQIKQMIEYKKKLIEKKKANLAQIEEKKKAVIQQFKQERTEFMSENKQVARAFRDRYVKDQDNQAMLRDTVEKLSLVYRQRLGRILQDFFQTFFIPELSQMYKGLEHYQDAKPFNIRPLDNSEQEYQLSVALGQLVLLAIHLMRTLCIPMKHSMIYNSARSSIVMATEKETQVLPLYISKSYDYRTLDQAITLLGHNLRHCLRAIERLQKRDGLGNVQANSQQRNGGQGQQKQVQETGEVNFPNFLLNILFRIAEFQIY